jgi:hypothetical protein
LSQGPPWSVCDLEHDLSGLVGRAIQHAVGGARVCEVENLTDRQLKPSAMNYRQEIRKAAETLSFRKAGRELFLRRP